MKRSLVGIVLLASVAGCAAPEGAASGQASVPVHFLSERENDWPDMTALTEGTLVLEEGCLRIRDASESYTAVWPSGFGFRVEGGAVDILGREGERVARVGERVLVGGGELGRVTPEELAPSVTQPVRCAGTYWLVASVEARAP